MNAQYYEVKRKVTMLKSQVDRLDGKVTSLLEEVISQSKKIQKLEDKQARLDGLRAGLS